MLKKLMLMTALAMGITQGAVAGDMSKQVAANAVAQWNTVLKKGSVDELLRLYAEDAMVLMPNGEATKDPRAIRKFWRHLLAKQAGRYELDLGNVIYAKDDTVVSTLRWSNVDGNLKYSYDGVIYNVFKRQPDGSWKAQVQRWN
ncbi:MAG: YybH family protein [Methylohalobius sp. ZOD2]